MVAEHGYENGEALSHAPVQPAGSQQQPRQAVGGAGADGWAVDGPGVERLDGWPASRGERVVTPVRAPAPPASPAPDRRRPSPTPASSRAVVGGRTWRPCAGRHRAPRCPRSRAARSARRSAGRSAPRRAERADATGRPADRPLGHLDEHPAVGVTARAAATCWSTPTPPRHTGSSPPSRWMSRSRQRDVNVDGPLPRNQDRGSGQRVHHHERVHPAAVGAAIRR